jgi:antitoxin component HigA of HigAB toxin-antitoxin module
MIDDEIRRREKTRIGLSMASKRSRSKPRTKSMTSAPMRARRFAFFGPPPLLEGEDPALYDELVGRMCAAVKPVDMIDELFVADVVSLEWEILRWRRLKVGLLQGSLHEVLQHFFLNRRLDYEAYAEDFAAALAENLAEILPESPEKDRAEEANELAHRYARSQPDAIKKVRQLLKAAGLDADQILDQILEQAKDQRAAALVREYARRQPEAIQLVNELLASSGETMHDLTLSALLRELDKIEQIDRLLTIAETRRNISLREMDRHRAVLGEALRRNLQEVEDGEFEVIETIPAQAQRPVQARRESRTATNRPRRIRHRRSSRH